MLTDPKIAVCSRSFSKSKLLRESLMKSFNQVCFNDSDMSLSGSSLAEFLSGKDVAIIGLEKITKEMLSQCPQLKVLCKMGTGTDKIDLQALKNRGGLFFNTPGFNKSSVAEIVLSHALILMRNILENYRQVQNGQWKQIIGNELSNKKIGIMGFGVIGQEVARLFLALGCTVCAYDVQRELVSKFDNVFYVSPNKIFSSCDVVSVHIPLNQETRHIISASLIDLLKTGSVFINTSRGEVVDQAALKNRLLKREILAGLDVLEDEPSVDFELAKLDNVLVTPHIGGSTHEAVLINGLKIVEYLESLSILELMK